MHYAEIIVFVLDKHKENTVYVHCDWKINSCEKQNSPGNSNWGNVSSCHLQRYIKDHVYEYEALVPLLSATLKHILICSSESKPRCFGFNNNVKKMYMLYQKLCSKTKRSLEFNRRLELSYRNIASQQSNTNYNKSCKSTISGSDPEKTQAISTQSSNAHYVGIISKAY